MADPRTDAEWQEAVDQAEFLQLLDSARKYGLVTGGPTVNLDRCAEILAEGPRRGVTPSADCCERIIKALKAGS